MPWAKDADLLDELGAARSALRRVLPRACSSEQQAWSTTQRIPWPRGA